MRMIFEGLVRRDKKARWLLDDDNNCNTLEDILWEIEGKRVRVIIEEVKK